MDTHLVLYLQLLNNSKLFIQNNLLFFNDYNYKLSLNRYFHKKYSNKIYNNNHKYKIKQTYYKKYFLHVYISIKEIENIILSYLNTIF
jgi:hypothetical protein